MADIKNNNKYSICYFDKRFPREKGRVQEGGERAPSPTRIKIILELCSTSVPHAVPTRTMLISGQTLLYRKRFGSKREREPTLQATGKRIRSCRQSRIIDCAFGLPFRGTEKFSG